MARVTTKTGIANIALSLLKVDAVTSIDPPDSRSKAAKKAAQWYDESRREVLADHTWNFAMKRAQLPAAAEAPAFGYTNKFLLPADYVRVATIGDELNPETEYTVEDGYILTDLAAPIDLRYVFDQEDVTKYSPKFIQCLARKLATHLAYDFTGNRSMVETMDRAYTEMLSDARGIDGQEAPPQGKIRNSKWAHARYGGHRGLFGYMGQRYW